MSAQDTALVPKRVLVIFLFKQGIPWMYYIEQSLRTTLATESASPIHLDIEYADQSRFPKRGQDCKAANLSSLSFS